LHDDAYGDRERCGIGPPPERDDRICARSATQALIHQVAIDERFLGKAGVKVEAIRLLAALLLDEEQ
jgi:hypothetical protein